MPLSSFLLVSGMMVIIRAGFVFKDKKNIELDAEYGK